MDQADRSRDEKPVEERLRRLKFRAWHRGTREADYMMGCFFDKFHATWSAGRTTREQHEGRRGRLLHRHGVSVLR